MPDLLHWRSLDIMGKSLVVGLAQLVERQIVVLEVVGSNPTSHPTPSPNRESATGTRCSLRPGRFSIFHEVTPVSRLIPPPNVRRQPHGCYILTCPLTKIAVLIRHLLRRATRGGQLRRSAH